jgi:hypothetical protein
MFGERKEQARIRRVFQVLLFEFFIQVSFAAVNHKTVYVTALGNLAFTFIFSL